MDNKNTPLYHFESSDSLARFSAWILPLCGGGIITIMLWTFGGVIAIIGAAIAVVLAVIGLRASISVRNSEVIIEKKWFFILYRKYVAPEIEDVWFGGDWGLEDGAMGVVVQLANQEVHIGTSKNMKELYDALLPFSAEYKSRIADKAM